MAASDSAHPRNYALAQLLHGNWRWMFGLGAIPAVALCVSLVWIPESPRWLVQRGYRDRARTVLQRISPDVAVEGALEKISKALSEETGTYRDLLSRSLRSRW